MEILELITSKFGDVKNALIEAGHFYVQDDITDQHLTGALLGKQIADEIRAVGVNAITSIFVDDYSNGCLPLSDQDTEVKLQQYDQRGFTPDIVYYEKDMVGQARALSWEMKQDGKVVVFKNGKHFLKEDGTFLSDGVWPGCSLLDAALFCKKHESMPEEGGVCITVLPDTYKTQQQSVKKILNAAGKQIPIINIYYDKEGNLTYE